VAKTGSILQKIDEVAGTVTDSPVAILFDWENWWALDDAQGYALEKKYLPTCYEYHRFFWERGINCDIVSPKADLSRYKLVVAPMLYLTGGDVVENLESYVNQGGTLYGTYMMGTVDDTDLCWLGGIPGSRLKEVFGIVAEEIDTLYPVERQHASGHQLVDYCEVLQLRGAEPLAVYDDGYYKDTAAVTAHPYGKGRAVYQACRDTGSLKDAILGKLIEELKIPSAVRWSGALPHGVSAHSRRDGGISYIFVENYMDTPAPTIPLHAPATDLLTGETTDSVTLPPYGFAILKSQ
jgi:beta-galactosidase